MKRFTIAAWLMILVFLVWSGNLLLNIQSQWQQASELHAMSANLDHLASAWRDLSRPGNDVLENYEVALQRGAFEVYAGRYEAIREVVLQHTQFNSEQASFLRALDQERDTLSALAQEIFDLAEQREKLRDLAGPPESILEKETEAASKMARMDQAFQYGLDQILMASDSIVVEEQRLEVKQRRNFQRLYVMLLVALLASALSVELVRRTVRQREALRDSEVRIKAIVDNVVDGILTVDEKGRVASMNPPAEAMFGYAADEVLGKPFTLLLDETCRGAYRDRLNRGANPVITSFTSSECEARGLRRNGASFPLDLAASEVMVKGRRLLIHIVRDITERRRADEKQRLAASVFENTNEGILITDAQGSIQSVNRAFTVITQYRAEEVIGENPRILGSGKQKPEFYRQMWESLIESGRWQGEIWNRRKNGEIYPQWLTISAIKDPRGNTTNYVGVTWDITERKRAEETAKRHQEELAHVMRLSTMGEMASGMAHELNQPLMAASSYCETALGMLANLPSPPQKLSGLLQRALEQTHRAGDIIRHLRDFVSKGRASMELVDVDQLIREVIDLLEWELRHTQVKIELRLDGTDCRVKANKVQIEQVLLNLVRNSLEAIQSGSIADGQLILATRVLPGDRIQVTLSDNGPGIAAEMVGKIFDPFQTNKGTGMGMGLSISRSIIEAHGGKLWVAESPNGGALFGFELPAGGKGAHV
jgi:two-component system sensor kinase FixL